MLFNIERMSNNTSFLNLRPKLFDMERTEMKLKTTGLGLLSRTYFRTNFPSLGSLDQVLQSRPVCTSPDVERGVRFRPALTLKWV